ncbi:hypothetical protein [Bacillus cihuensis]|nr:hypothetical protein [Bacillus cihuensis]
MNDQLRLLFYGNQQIKTSQVIAADDKTETKVVHTEYQSFLLR